MSYNVYRDLGCSQESHIPNCGHFGYAGTYLSEHLKTCPQFKGNTKPCNCNPMARKAVEKALREGKK